MPALTRDPNPVPTNGLSQPQRQRAALRPAFWQADERGMADLLRFARAFADGVGVKFYDERGTPDAGEMWKALMNAERDVASGALVTPAGAVAPHMALFIAFLHLFGKAQERLNTFTEKHLDYYYKEVLQVANRPARPDDVFVLFELAKNASEQIIAEGTGLDAKKDDTRQPLTYVTTAPLTVNRAAVAFRRTLYRNPADQKLYFAPAADTLDGVAQPLSPARPFWNAFGPSARPAVTCGGAPPTQTINRPEARLGFALASGVLRLAEGKRTITVTLITNVAAPALAGVKLRLELSGEKAWLTVPDEATLTVSGTTVTFTAVLPADRKDAVVNYHDKLDGGYATSWPVLRCWLVNTADYANFHGVQLTTIKLDVAVEGLKKTLSLENDLGPVSPEKPFMPFGATPSTGATLYVGSAEAVGKNLTKVQVNIPDWVGLPGSFNTHYAGYDATYQTRSNFKATTKILNGNLKAQATDQRALFASYAASVPPTPPSGGWSFYPYYVMPYYGVYSTYYWTGGGSFMPLQTAFFFGDSGPTATRSASDALLSVTLDKDLGHGAYPKLLTEKTIAKVAAPTDTSIVIPNAPYAPLAKELTVNYDATTGDVALTLNATATDAQAVAGFAGRQAQLFHLGPFGQAEENPFLKRSATFLSNADRSTYWLPQTAPEGQFLLGLADVGPGEAVSLLILAAEGSANPERDPATVVWSVLSRNQWRKLANEDVLSDTTNHLLQSGIIKLSLPPETTLNNTLLDAGYVWLRAELRKPDGTPAPPDSVAEWRAVHTQAVLARFQNNNNDPARAGKALPAQTIQKLRQPLAAIKGVVQPAPSFGGAAEEDDRTFQTRVSERLRHKGRAVAAWDYEHLVLQAFPAVYKAKCLRHTRLDAGLVRDLSPGHVTLIVVPDLRGRNVALASADTLEPKVDLATLASVKTFLQRRMGKLLTVDVANPAYERIKIGAKVAFRPGYEFAPYRRQLLRDLTGFLAPWSADTDAEILFEGTLTKSDVIAFAERLPYVDFLTDVTLQHYVAGVSTRPDNDVVRASTARAVLTSCPAHDILEFDGC